MITLGDITLYNQSNAARFACFGYITLRHIVPVVVTQLCMCFLKESI